MLCSSLLLAAAAGYVVLPPSIGVLARTRARAAPVQCRIELQSAFGRGNAHLSWNVEDGDIVVYQVGTWLVDNVEVGDGSPARMRFARVDNVQINWTHNCEHGVIRGTAMYLGGDGSTLDLDEEEEIQFGPEQVCIPSGRCRSLHAVCPSLSLRRLSPCSWLHASSRPGGRRRRPGPSSTKLYRPKSPAWSKEHRGPLDLRRRRLPHRRRISFPGVVRRRSRLAAAMCTHRSSARRQMCAR